MILPIIHDEAFLKQPSQPSHNTVTAANLLDTLKANRQTCIGMAANMIGRHENIIAFLDGDTYKVMYNPQILKKSGLYTTEEGCLSLTGMRKTKRAKHIKVKYEDSEGQTYIKSYHGLTAQIIQHEIDHCRGILI